MCTSYATQSNPYIFIIVYEKLKYFNISVNKERPKREWTDKKPAMETIAGLMFFTSLFVAVSPF